LVRCVIYARMSPDEKHEIVERLQDLGYTVGFCGDGANDCGALKAADVGISLSEAEASVAAPFTSRSTDISCFLDVVREGRAALVTSFSCFKFMALYSLIQFTTVTLLYALASSLGDFQFLYIDLAIIIPIAVTMGRTGPFQRIHPKRPTANLVSKKVLTSLLGHILITSGLQAFVFVLVRSQPW
jgi:cation-transporting ATPase 13A2